LLENPESPSYHNAAGNGRREGLKNGGIGQSAAEPLCRKVGEGSTTRAYHLRPQQSGTVMKPVGRQKALEVPGPEQARKSAAGEDIVWSTGKPVVATMAKEMMEFTKMNILQQAAQAMLAQANQQPQGVLQLLR